MTPEREEELNKIVNISLILAFKFRSDLIRLLCPEANPDIGGDQPC